ncbi:MAG TPA: LuxR C-terminal-related transcriptional regulator [Microvirga sp.]|jgi:DNA-binding CsgD family transcriptional regulator|nr:LuxR C-terminal-related transcriptional regulator [Microvirga sp.]
MIKNRVEIIDQDTLRISGARTALRAAAAAAPERETARTALGGDGGLSAAIHRGGEWAMTPNLAECLVPALRVLSHQVERLEDELSAARKERDAERARVAELIRTLEKTKTVLPAGLPSPFSDVGDGGTGDADSGTSFPRLSTRQKQVLEMISQGKSTKDIARELNLGIGTVKVHMSALYSALGVSSRSAALAASYHHLSRAGQGREAVAA